MHRVSELHPAGVAEVDTTRDTPTARRMVATTKNTVGGDGALSPSSASGDGASDAAGASVWLVATARRMVARRTAATARRLQRADGDDDASVGSRRVSSSRENVHATAFAQMSHLVTQDRGHLGSGMRTCIGSGDSGVGNPPAGGRRVTSHRTESSSARPSARMGASHVTVAMTLPSPSSASGQMDGLPLRADDLERGSQGASRLWRRPCEAYQAAAWDSDAYVGSHWLHSFAAMPFDGD